MAARNVLLAVLMPKTQPWPKGPLVREDNLMDPAIRSVKVHRSDVPRKITLGTTIFSIFSHQGSSVCLDHRLPETGWRSADMAARVIFQGIFAQS